MRKRASENYKVGQIVNSNLTILKLDYKIIRTKKLTRLYSRIKCLLCGNEKDILTFQIAQDKSCKCRNYIRKVYSKKKLFWSYKQGALSRNLTFELSYDEFCNLTSRPCYYCGSIRTIFINKDCVNKNINLNNLCSGIDRIDNKMGYITNNVVPCCKICNRGKGNLSKERWLKYLDILVEFRLTKKDCQTEKV